MPKPSDPATKRLIDELNEAVHQSGLRRDDPIAPLIRGLVYAIRHVSERTARSDRVAIDASRRIAATVGEIRHAADAESDRFRLELASVEAETVKRIADAIVVASDVAWTRRVRIFDRNTAFLAALTIFAVASASFAGGIWWGRNAAFAVVRETESALQAAFREGPETALAWSKLMTWNDLRGSLAACNAAPARSHLQEGRRFCDVPLWIESIPTPPRDRSESQWHTR